MCWHQFQNKDATLEFQHFYKQTNQRVFLIKLSFGLSAVGGEVYDRGGSHDSVHEQSSGDGERRQIQGGREVKWRSLNLHQFVSSVAAGRSENGVLSLSCSEYWMMAGSSFIPRFVTPLSFLSIMSFLKAPLRLF